MDKVVAAIKEDKLFDYISMEGYNLSKEELINIIKELSFAISKSSDKEEIIKEVIENINEFVL